MVFTTMDDRHGARPRTGAAARALVRRGATRHKALSLACAGLLAIGAAEMPAEAVQQHDHQQGAPVEHVTLGDMVVPDVALLDQDGNEVHFYSDLVKGKTVAINFVFTTCTTICPPMGANFARLQRALGERAVQASLISVSVDPVVDTPARLKAWRGQFGAGDGWTLVTGAKAAVDELLKALGVFTADKLDHGPTLLIGNDATGAWTRANGLAAPDTLVALIEGMQRAADSTDAQRRGRQIYATGANAAGGAIIAALGDGDVEVPATVVPCAGCHGADGKGNAEGGLVPSDLTWSTLTKPYGETRPDGRHRPPYTRDTLGRAILLGVDSGGQALDRTMPRYRLDATDLADLLAYLEAIGELADAGIDDGTLVVGVPLPPPVGGADTRGTGIGAAIRAVLNAYYSEINRRGGLYGRQIALRFVELPRNEAETGDAIVAFVDEAGPFALVAAFVGSAGEALERAASGRGVPVVGAVATDVEGDAMRNRQVFYLYGGAIEEARALAAFLLLERPAASRAAAVVHGGDERSARLAAAIEAELTQGGVFHVATYAVTDGAVSADRLAVEMRDAAIEAVFFIGAGDAAVDFLAAARRAAWRPLLLSSGATTGETIFSAAPESSAGVYLSFPVFPSDRTDEALLEYRSLVEAYALPPNHQSVQLTALTSARLLVEVLARAGRDVSREKLVRELEGTWELETGLSPRISYGPNRRIGSLGAYVVRVDLAARVLENPRWVALQ